jgi:Na+-transporting methylmalonyl-CoA/oxaloacetate decarboxylase gamma subunit
MMGSMAGRRLLVFIVLLLLVAAIASAIAPREKDLAERTVEPAVPPPAAAARVVEGVLPDDRRVRARVGDIVQIEVRHTAQDEVQVLALGLSEPVEPGIAAQIVFDADREGQFPVTLRDAARRLGTVEVRPAG